MPVRYLAVIGDVVHSRGSSARNQLQQQLNQALRSANESYSAALASRFVLTLGDEFQGLLTETEPVVELMAELRSAVHPAELRFGLGVGPLETPLRAEAIGMDGPCFHRARRAIERARQQGTALEAEAPGAGAALAIYGLLYGELRGRWTERQRQVFDLAASGLEGRAIAARLDISPSAVSQHLQAAGRKRVQAATERWRETLETSLKHGGNPP